MTAAVCIKCGAMKIGAFTRCPECGFTPTSADDQARSIVLSDHNLEREALEEAARHISAGTQPSFDEAAIAQMAQEMVEFQKHPPSFRGCSVIWWSLIALMCILLLVVVLLFWYVKKAH